jgi:hypothetical protein
VYPGADSCGGFEKLERKPDVEVRQGVELLLEVQVAS